jgi:hypothetical protein
MLLTRNIYWLPFSTTDALAFHFLWPHAISVRQLFPFNLCCHYLRSSGFGSGLGWGLRADVLNMLGIDKAATAIIVDGKIRTQDNVEKTKRQA